MGKPNDIPQDVWDAASTTIRSYLVGPDDDEDPRFPAMRRAVARALMARDERAATLVSDAAHHYDGLALEATDIAEKTQLNSFAEQLRDLAEAIRGEG